MAVDYQNIVDAYVKSIDAAEIAALKFLEGRIKFRVHNSGLKPEGQQIGQYSEGYKKVRKARGRQVGYVDLQFEGNLIKGYTTGITSDTGANCIGFINEAETRKAAENEARFGAPIFAPGDEEINKAMESYTAVLDKKLKDALQ